MKGLPGTAALMPDCAGRYAMERAAYAKEINFVRGLCDISESQKEKIIKELKILEGREYMKIFSPRGCGDGCAERRDIQELPI